MSTVSLEYLKGDCPVMSGFFHARKRLRVEKRNLKNRDCPVMSGFFHAL